MPDTQPPHTIQTVTPANIQPTTSSTTTVAIPAAPDPAYKRGLADWDNVVIMMVGIAAVLGFISLILTLANQASSLWGKIKKKNKEEDAPTLGRIDKLEKLIEGFRKGDDIDKDMALVKSDIKHMKANAVAVGDASAERFRRIESEAATDRTDLVRLETKVDGMSANFERVESAVERLAERMETRLDNIQQSLIDHPRPSRRTTTT